MESNNNNNYNRKKRTGWIRHFTVPTDYRVKLKMDEKRDKFLNLAREIKILRNMKVTMIPIVVGVLGINIKGLVNALGDLEIRGTVDTSQTTAVLISVRIPRRVLETWEDLLSLNFQWKILSYLWCKNSQKSNNNRGRIETLSTAILLRSARILRKTLKIGGGGLAVTQIPVKDH